MWIPKTPRRSDFCGRPPCSLCFDWAEDNGIDTKKGIDKMIDDLLEGKAPTEAQRKTIEDAAQRIHDGNLLRNTPIDQDEAIAYFHAQDSQQHMDRQLEAFLAQKRHEKEIKRPQLRQTLDQMELEKSEQMPANLWIFPDALKKALETKTELEAQRRVAEKIAAERAMAAKEWAEWAMTTSIPINQSLPRDDPIVEYNRYWGMSGDRGV